MSHIFEEVKPDPEQIADEDVLALQRNFSPTGIAKALNFHKRYRFDTRLYDKFFLRYSAAASAWMAGGMSNDGDQEWPQGQFHRQFSETWKGATSSHDRTSVRARLLWHTADMVRE